MEYENPTRMKSYSFLFPFLASWRNELRYDRMWRRVHWNIYKMRCFEECPDPPPPPTPPSRLCSISLERLGFGVISVMATFMWSAFEIRCGWFIKVRETIRMLFIYQAYLNDTESAIFVSQNDYTKCLCFYSDREWRSSLVLACIVFCYV